MKNIPTSSPCRPAQTGCAERWTASSRIAFEPLRGQWPKEQRKTKCFRIKQL
jgi:hypothetical protein